MFWLGFSQVHKSSLGSTDVSCVPDAKGFKVLRRLIRLFMSIGAVAIELLKMQNCDAL